MKYKYKDVKDQLPPHEGLKAAVKLLDLVADMARRGQIQLEKTAIDFGPAKTVEFGALEYVLYAKQECARVSLALWNSYKDSPNPLTKPSDWGLARLANDGPSKN